MRILGFSTFHAEVSTSFRQKNKRAAAAASEKQSWANTAKHSEASRSCCILTSLMWEKQRWSAEIYARRLSLSFTAASKDEKERRLKIQRFVKIPIDMCCQTTSSSIRHRRSVSGAFMGAQYLSLYFSFKYPRKMGVGKIPQIMKEWTCQREPSDKMSFVLFFSSLLVRACSPPLVAERLRWFQRKIRRLERQLSSLSCTFLMLLLPWCAASFVSLSVPQSWCLFLLSSVFYLYISLTLPLLPVCYLYRDAHWELHCCAPRPPWEQHSQPSAYNVK